MIRSPTSVDPVNAIFRTPGCRTNASPVPGPSPQTTLNTPSGSPPSDSSSQNRSVVSGVVGAGLPTTVFPATRAGASLLDSSVVGKFQGTIAPTTPNGRRSTIPSTPGSSPGVCAPRRAFDNPT